MALYLPPAIKISRFTGGYKSSSDFDDLGDTETSDSKNVEYGVGGNIEQRDGSVKLLNTSLSGTITGHYYYQKLGATTAVNVVATDTSLFSYTSATSTAIRTGLSGGSQSFWNFTQIQDPRSASDDVVLGTNGVDPIQLWNGSASAINLSSLTSATQVAVAKYMTQLKNKIYIANIVDSSNADHPVQVRVSSFGTDGAPDPHRFTDSFFVGGSDRGGEIQGIDFLNDQIIIYKKNEIWKFLPGSGATLDTAALLKVKDNIGLLAPRSLVNFGDFHIFLSEKGVFVFDGNNTTHISEKVDEELLRDSNRLRLKFAQGSINKTKSQYKLYFPDSGSTRNDKGFVFDFRINSWQPPITGRQVSIISTYTNLNDEEKNIYGDYLGFLFEDNNGSNDGLATGFNGTVDSSTDTVLTDTSQMFPTTGDGLQGIMVRVISGTGENQERVIVSNTSQTLTVDSPFVTVPDSSSTYTVGGIDSYWRSKDFDFGNADIVKLFRSMRLRTREEGNFNLDLHYIVDFKGLGRATKVEIPLLKGGFVWDLSSWDEASWGADPTIIQKIDFRSTAMQPCQGQYLAVRFSNRNANETWIVRNFDIELKAIGKR